MTELRAQIRAAVNSRRPIVYIVSPEEARIINVLTELVPSCIAGGTVTTWSCTSGLSLDHDPALDCRDPVVAIQQLMSMRPAGFVVMKDIAPFMHTPQFVRALRDFYAADNERCVLCLLATEAQIPPPLQKDVHLVDVPLPSLAELTTTLELVQGNYSDTVISDDVRQQIALCLRGLTLNEVDHLMHGILAAGHTGAEQILRAVFAEKERLVKKSGYLQFIPPQHDINDIGGLENLKDWMHKRETTFSQSALDAGLPIPKGVLLMGVSGCGKSLAAKAVAALWKIPLFRLDMNLVFSGIYGTPEATFHHALTTIESVAPAVLWIDELENGLGVSDGDIRQTHLFSAFLTWMQEKPPLIFVAATANNIHMLPAEVLRKGRFDQVFFCDLPTPKERQQIFNIHLQANGASPSEFDVDYLVVATEDWNGAEIEQAVIAGRIDAHQAGEGMTTDHIERHTRSMVPLSETMKEQIKAIRSWAWGRATPASSGKRRM